MHIEHNIPTREYKVSVHWDEETKNYVVCSLDVSDIKGYGKEEDEAIYDFAKKIFENTKRIDEA